MSSIEQQADAQPLPEEDESQVTRTILSVAAPVSATNSGVYRSGSSNSSAAQGSRRGSTSSTGQPPLAYDFVPNEEVATMVTSKVIANSVDIVQSGSRKSSVDGGTVAAASNSTTNSRKSSVANQPLVILFSSLKIYIFFMLNYRSILVYCL